MKKLAISFIALLLLLLACAPQAPTEIVEEPTPTQIPMEPTHIRVDLTPAQLASIAALSETLSLPAEQITLVSTEAVTWPDGCLGIQRVGMLCTQALVEGFKIILEAKDKQYEFHTNQSGSAVALAVDSQSSGQAEDAVIEQLAFNLGLKKSDILVVSNTGIQFGDACLGMAMEGVVCAQALTPGRIIVLKANDIQYEYHTNEDGSLIRPATIVLTWKREGGIAGFCDYLTVYLSGEVHGSSCESGSEYVEERLVNILSPEELTQLDEWVTDYGQVDIDASDPKGVSDRMVVVLTFTGTGSQQTISQPNRQELLEFAQLLNSKLYK